MRFFCIALLLFPLLLRAQMPILKAEKQHWVSGIINGGSGNKYTIVAIAPASDARFKVQGIWVGDNFFEVTVTKGLPYMDTKFSKGDTILLSFMENDKMQDNNVLDKPQPPKQYKGEALILYRIKGKRKYTAIEKFTSLKELLMR